MKRRARGARPVVRRHRPDCRDRATSRARRSVVLERGPARASIVADGPRMTGWTAALSASARAAAQRAPDEPLHAFHDRSWRRAARRGRGLLHPDGHLSDPKASRCAPRRTVGCGVIGTSSTNCSCFAGVSDTQARTGFNVYAATAARFDFTQAAFLYHPAVSTAACARRLGRAPRRELPTTDWDLAASRALVHVTNRRSTSWTTLIAYRRPAIDPSRRIRRPRRSRGSGDRPRSSLRLSATRFFWTTRIRRRVSRRASHWWTARTSATKSTAPTSCSRAHIGIAPRSRSSRDRRAAPAGLRGAGTSSRMPESVDPRTNWQRVPRSRRVRRRRSRGWDGRHDGSYCPRRGSQRVRPSATTERSLFVSACPAPARRSCRCYLGAFASRLRRRLRLCGLLSSLPYDSTSRVAA